MASDTKHIATDEDFRRATELRQAERVERVILPRSGLAVMLRRLPPMWFLFHGVLPRSLAERLEGDLPGQGSVNTVEDLKALANWAVTVLREVFVQPKLSLHPSPGEISPEWLEDEDVNFIFRWVVGEVGPDSRDDLAAFRDKREPAAASSSGGNVVVPTERTGRSSRNDGTPN